MATEYKLSYTGAEINEKLGKVDELSEAIDGKAPKTLTVNVTEDDGNLVADKTYAEIVEQINDGGVVQVFIEPDTYYTFHSVHDNVYWFVHDFDIAFEHITINPNNEVDVVWQEKDVNAIPLPESASVGQMFKISAVDENGRVTETDVMDVATDDDAIDILAELGVVEPITNSAGAIYTDTNGAIYSL